ncbi:MAG: hypothetical protein ACLR5H_09965 [Oscillospiraceae bacterium]
MAALCYGPESVLVIAGMNKVMGDLDSAIAWARQGGGSRQRPAGFDIKDPLRRYRKLRRLHQSRLHLLPGGHHPGLSPCRPHQVSFWWARIWAFKAKEGST